MTIAKLLFVLALIIFGIRRKIFVGYLLLGAGVLLPLLFGFSVAAVVQGVGGTLISAGFWQLFGAIVIVTFLGQLLRRIGYLKALTIAAQNLAGGKRTAVAVLPAAIGMMPMPAGALLSAPLVEEVLQSDNKPPQFMAATNYWYRHVMEFFWPLYPGILLGAGITGLPIQDFAAMGLPMSLVMAFLGYLFFLRKIEKTPSKSNGIKAVIGIIGAIWPFFLAVVLALFAGMDIVMALGIAVVATILTHKGSWREVIPVMREHITLRLFFMVFGILVFKDLLELSGAVGSIPGEVERLGIPPFTVIFLVSFLSGLLTGMVAAFVGLSFPILAGFLYLPEINASNIFFAYLCGYFGMIISPTHFCLILSSEHFKADLGSVYRTMVKGLMILILFGFALYFSGYPWHLVSPGG